MSEKVRAADIIVALAKKHEKRDLFFTEVCAGGASNGRRLDAVAVMPSWKDRRVCGYEVKVSRSDFLRDDKWPAYLSVCHQFSFACPAGLIAKEELNDNIGLLYYYPESGALKTIRKPVYREDCDPIDVVWSILINRVEDSGSQISARLRTVERLRGYVKDGSDLRNLGHMLGTVMARRVSGLENELSDAKWEITNLQRENNRLSDLVRRLTRDTAQTLTSTQAARELERIVGLSERVSAMAKDLAGRVGHTEVAGQ